MASGHAWQPAVAARSSMRAAVKAASAFQPDLVALKPAAFCSARPCSANLPGVVDMKFPRKVRLTRQAQFRDVFAQANASRDRYFRVLSRPNQLDYSRLGLAVSKRNCRLASTRNRIKRVIRESFRHHQFELAQNGGLDLVVLPSAASATICKRDLAASLAAHWKKLSAKGGPQTHNKSRKDH